MPKRRLLWHAFPSFALLVAAAVLALGWTALAVLESNGQEAARARLLSLADLLDVRLGPDAPSDRADFARLACQLDETCGVRIALLLPDGAVDTDSQGRPEELANQLDRPELRSALAGGAHDAVRYNPGLDERMMYVAVPVLRHDRLFGVFYLTTRLGRLDAALGQVRLWIAIVGLGLLALALLLAWRLAGGISAPLAVLRAAADRLAEGQWGVRVAVPDARELAEGAEAFNRMADRIQTTIGRLTQQHNEQRAVLASMAEGVLAVDSQQCIISLNAASGRLLGLDQAHVQGRRLQEVVRNADLNRFVGRVLDHRQPIEADVLLHGEKVRVMQAHGAPLDDLQGRPIGAVIVLNDVTDFRKLEHLRRDFVANVSHELKTPVTSIKGFVETLLDGALRDPVDSERFLRIVAKQADRLHAIIEDLLALSKIEQEEDSEDVKLEMTSLGPILESAAAACAAAAAERRIDVEVECPPPLAAPLNPLLFEQAVLNLLDNAIKYSEPEHAVRVVAAAAPGELTVSVSDSGCGIAEEHLARIFERFYRVDRARSRKLGGTGLGLAIVKHIVQAHRGTVTVDSRPGAGSTFTIHLPQSPSQPAASGA